MPTTIFNDGATHTINGPSADISVQNGTTLNVVTGASVQGANVGSGLTDLGLPGITSTGSTINVSGGAIAAGTRAAGLFASSSDVTISGGIISGGDASYDLVYRDGGAGLFFWSATNTLQISGGTLKGGVSCANPGRGTGARLVLTGASATASISGGDFISGAVSCVFDGALSILASGGGSATISGGTFTGGYGHAAAISLALSGGSSVVFQGTGLSIVPETNAVTGQWLAYGGYWPYHLTGALTSGQAIDVYVLILFEGYSIDATPTQVTISG